MTEQQRASAKVTLEDLLRVKRAERPPAEFWVEFDRSLRAKQLAALVQKRPWWKSWSVFYRWSVPVGAAAALTVTVVSLSSRAPSRQVQVAAKSQPAVLAKTEVSDASPVVGVHEEDRPVANLVSVASADLPAAQHSEMPAADVAEPTAPAPAAVPTAAGQLASVTERVAGILEETEADSMPVARFATTTPKSNRLPSFMFDRGTAVAQTDDSLRAAKVNATEPLAQMTTPRDARRARLLAFTSSVDTRTPQYSNSTGVIRSRERIATHLNEEALYDSMRRLGVKDGGVSIQF